MAAPLGHDSQPLPAVVKEIVTKARTTWLKNDEVLKILQHYKSFDLPIGKEAPKSPGGELLKALPQITSKHYMHVQDIGLSEAT